MNVTVELVKWRPNVCWENVQQKESRDSYTYAVFEDKKWRYKKNVKLAAAAVFKHTQADVCWCTLKNTSLSYHYYNFGNNFSKMSESLCPVIITIVAMSSLTRKANQNMAITKAYKNQCMLTV
ncbi:hypothetical protein BsWGS_11148 [Bradybaena similaris]